MKLTIRLIIRGDAIRKYVDQWIIGIEDATELTKEIFAAVKRGEKTIDLVPELKEYTVPENIKQIIGYL